MKSRSIIAVLAALAWSASAAQQPAALDVADVADGIHVLFGAGGNIGVSSGDDGVVLIDDQFSHTVPQVKAAVATISDQPVRLVLNTHWHFDHTGGNQGLARDGAMIVAHDNVRVRMNSRHFSTFFKSTTEPSPAEALPVVTFESKVTLHLNGQTIDVVHVPTAHTDGDSIIYFVEANVVHMGDNFFNGLYPFIDGDSGGSIVGMTAAIDVALERIDAQTRIIPGHGPLSDREGLLRFRAMLDTVATRIRAAMDAGKSLEEIVAMKPTADFDAEWGNGFIKPDDWVGLVHNVISRNLSKGQRR